MRFLYCGLLMLTLGVGLFSSCSDSNPSTDSPPMAAPEWSAVVSDALIGFQDDLLPRFDDATLDELAELLDLSTIGEAQKRRVQRKFSQMDPGKLTDAMLSIVEGRESEPEIRAEAYAWLKGEGVSAMVPRLTLRLKYEKDWVANVDIALGLLRFGNGAGLEPLINILRTEEGIPDLDRARWKAIAALSLLPPTEGWVPGEDFDADWQRLLEVNQIWQQNHTLPGFDESAPPPTPYRAEIWQTIAKFRSQPLRPVDDARYVLTRQISWVYLPLSQTTRDLDPYVREHALQSLAWSGRSVGAWSKRRDFDLVSQLAPLAADGRLRPRVLEAMGASGLASMQDVILPWLQEGNLEDSTAAADALLRCADTNLQPAVQALLSSDPALSPEAHYSLQKLLQAFDATHVPLTPNGIDSSEIARRDRWAQQRDLTE